MRLLRLHPDSPESWGYWPIFEQRAVAFIETIGRECASEQFVRWLRESFVQRAEILGAWVALDDTRVAGHLLAWADAFFGEPFVFVYQVESEPGATLATLRAEMITELRHWIDAMNWAYERAGVTQRIRRVRFATARHERAWQGYLKELGEVEKVRSIITVRVGEGAPVVAEALRPPPGQPDAVNGVVEA